MSAGACREPKKVARHVERRMAHALYGHDGRWLPTYVDTHGTVTRVSQGRSRHVWDASLEQTTKAGRPAPGERKIGK